MYLCVNLLFPFAFHIYSVWSRLDTMCVRSSVGQWACPCPLLPARPIKIQCPPCPLPEKSQRARCHNVSNIAIYTKYTYLSIYIEKEWSIVLQSALVTIYGVSFSSSLVAKYRIARTSHNANFVQHQTASIGQCCQTARHNSRELSQFSDLSKFRTLRTMCLLFGTSGELIEKIKPIKVNPL